MKYTEDISILIPPAMSKTFSIKEPLRFAWHTFKQQWLLLAGIALFYIAVSAVTNAVATTVQQEGYAVVSTLISIIGAVFNALLTLGFYFVALQFSRHEKGRFADLFSQWKLLGTYLVASILYGLLLVAGFLLLVFPAFIWGVKFQFYDFFILDKHAGAIAALKQSSQLTNGVKWSLFGFDLILLLIVVIGSALFGIGLLVALPVVFIAQAVAYQQLRTQTETSSI